MKPTTKRGQMELLGIAIIVVIVSIGMLYVLAFVATREPSLIHPKFVEKQLAQNYLIALTRTTTDCKEQTVAELLQDCATDQTTICETGITSCMFLDSLIGGLLTETVSAWEFPYRFRAYVEDPDTNLIIPLDAEALDGPSAFHQNCNENRDQEAPGILYLPLENKFKLTLMLEICKVG